MSQAPEQPPHRGTGARPELPDVDGRGAPADADPQLAAPHDNATHDHDHDLDHATHDLDQHDHDQHAHEQHDHDQHDHDQHDHGGHDHEQGAHNHQNGHGVWGRLKDLVAPHSHDAAVAMDSELETSAKGMRALLISFAALLVTACLQALVVAFTGSVALLGDTIHNFADALTAVPIAVAFTLGRRAPNRRYTYGYGRAEDLAGIAVVLVIAASAAIAGYAAIRRLLDPQPVSHLAVVAVAGVVGFLGNELVARYRISVGRAIGSAALVADGLHARTDGFTSLAVVVGAAGVALGFPAADPIVGLLITVAILVVLRDAAREVYRRLMDSVDPDLVDQVEAVARDTDGVIDVGDVRVRWIGHTLRAELEVVVDDSVDVITAHDVTVDTEHRLIHAIPRLTTAVVHADPVTNDRDHHADLGHHRGVDPPVDR